MLSETASAAAFHFPTIQETLTTQNLLALTTLTAMEVVLGIDNIVFIAIVAGKLPEHQREKARVIGLALALVTRILLLSTLTLIMSMATKDLFELPFAGDSSAANPEGVNMVSGKDIILLLGGGFLIFKATKEIHANMEREDHSPKDRKVVAFWPTIGFILLIDLVFSIDSVVTAVGMAQNLWVMIAAVIISVIVMLIFSGYITRFINRNPTLKMLALSFLMLIGIVLVAEGAGQHIPKGYIYFGMAFSLGVEMLNLVTGKRSAKVA